MSDGTLLCTLEGHTSGVTSVVFAPDGQTLASASNDQTVKLWRVSDGTLLRTMEGHNGRVLDIAFAPDGQMTATPLRTFSGHMGHVLNVAFSPDGKTALSGSSDTTLRL